MAIAATRMHRSLVDYAFGSSEKYDRILLLLFILSLIAVNVVLVLQVHGNLNNKAPLQPPRSDGFAPRQLLPIRWG